MGTKQLIRATVALVLALGLSGCLEIETTTTVRTDGTLVREMTMSSDSPAGDTASVRPDEWVFPIDSTWSVVRRKSGDTTKTITATKTFENAEALEKALNARGAKSLQVRVEFAKHFRWFTTEFEYRETILSFNQFHEVPISRYLPEEDLKNWIHHDIEKAPYASREDSIALSKALSRAEEWDARNKFEAYFAILADGIRTLHDPSFSEEKLIAAKEHLYDCTSGIFAKSSGKLDTLQSVVEGALRTPVMRKVYEYKKQEFDTYFAKVKLELDMLGTPYKEAHIVMPGLITETNSQSVEGNKVTWRDFAGACYVADFAMSAKSRVINWPAVVGTGVVVVALLGILITGALRRRGGRGELDRPQAV